MVSGRGGAIAPDIMDAMRVYLGSDHAGFELKARLVAHLTELGHEPIDCGAHTFDPQDDYPPPCIAAAARTVANPGSLGIVIGGSGNGEQIAANKVKGVRAALAWNEETATLGRQHNNANVVAVGARMHTVEQATKFVEIFLGTPFSGDERHSRRIDMLSAYETTGDLPPIPAHHPEQ
jgi:ribose 5-phosphate isomerase B